MDDVLKLQELTWKLVVPAHVRSGILKTFHDDSTAGHLGISKTWRRIRALYFWPSLYRDVKRYVLSCDSCQRNKLDRKGPHGVLMTPDLDLTPFEKVGIDFRYFYSIFSG